MNSELQEFSTKLTAHLKAKSRVPVSEIEIYKNSLEFRMAGVTIEGYVSLEWATTYFEFYGEGIEVIFLSDDLKQSDSMYKLEQMPDWAKYLLIPLR